MKPEIHPEYEVATVNCACGNTFETKNTIGDLKIEICNLCHPFFTGTMKIIDAEGRVDRFNKRYRQAGK